MKHVCYIIIIGISFFQFGCQKDEKERWSGVYAVEFHSKLPDGSMVINKDPFMTFQILPNNFVQIENYVTVPLSGNRFQADIACCTTAFYSAYELVIDGTFVTRKGISTIQGYYNALGQAGPVPGVFIMKKIK